MKAMNNKTLKKPVSLYAAFDTYPAPKGAAIHIREFSSVLFETVKPGLLLTLGNEEIPSWQFETDFEIKRMVSQTSNFLCKTLEFYNFVKIQAQALKENLKIAHFRDPWGGAAILDVCSDKTATIFEVNALPSIELPFRYPGVGSQTLEKIHRIEKRCLKESDLLICPSKTIKSYLSNLGIKKSKIQVISNGADIPEKKPEKPINAPEDYLIYFGAVQSWQGIEILFKSLRFLRDFQNLKLVLCISGAKQRIKYLRKLSERMEISDKIIWNIKLPQPELFSWLAHARISVAPLTECSRNLVQGCCPLKVVETMAYKIPLIASDIPVIRELVENRKEGWLVRPDRPAELARAIRLLLLHPEQAAELGKNGFLKAVKAFSWTKSRNSLKKIYCRF
jgi:glycosyltransferase involved in cell wall biosynthesis